MSHPYDFTSPPAGLPPGDPGGFGASPSESIDLSKYLSALRRRWYLVVVCVILALAAALVRHSLTPKVFRATTVIQIERKRLAFAAMGRDSWLENWWNLEYYPTQYRLLRSRGMAERVVVDLRLYEDPAFTGGKPVQLSSIALGAAVDPSLGVEGDAELAKLGSRLQGGLSVEPVKDTQLVELSFESSTPELAARVANGYAKAFITWGVETRKGTVDRASAFLTQQVETLSKDIESQRQKLSGFGRVTDLTLDPAGEQMVERRSMLEEQYNKALANHFAKEIAYQEILDLPPESVADRAMNGRVGLVKGDLLRLEGEYEAQLEIYRPEWPTMVELKEKIESKRRELQGLVREGVSRARDQSYAELQSARVEKAGLEETLRQLDGESLKLNSGAIEYNNLKTVIRTRQELLNDLVKRQSETEVASQIQDTVESNVRIVDRAIVPGYAIRPILRQDLTLALGAGLLLGLGAIVLLESLDRTIKHAEELERITGLPTLAVIPELGAKTRAGGYGGGYGYGAETAVGGRGGRRPVIRRTSPGSAAGPEERIELLPHHNPRLAICEAYRSLRTALLLSSAEELKIVALTSAESGEGKTATAANVAVVMAQLGRRVLVLDCDLRRPRMHKVFGISNRVGIVSGLTGGAELDRIFFETVVPNLYLCPSGPIPPNPSELLASERMRDLLKSLRARFDFIVLDSPPVLPVADAVILGALADGVVVCAGAGLLVRDAARACRERLSYGGNLRIFGTVLNRHRDEPGEYRKHSRYYTAYEENGAGADSNAA